MFIQYMACVIGHISCSTRSHYLTVDLTVQHSGTQEDKLIELLIMQDFQFYTISIFLPVK